MFFAVCSDRGAPGSTTVTLALAAVRGLPSVVVEADPYGGDLALRCRIDGDPLPPTPTVLGLGAGSVEPCASDGLRRAAASRDRRLDLWRDGAHQLTNLVRVVPGFSAAEQGTSLSWASVAATVGSQQVPVFADLGRIHAGSPSMPMACDADALIAVCRGDFASVQHMIWRLEHLVRVIVERTGRPPTVIPVVVAMRRNGPRAASQVAELLAETGVSPTVGGVGWIAWDPTGVSRLQAGADPWAKPLYGSPLLKSARSVVGLLAALTGLDHADPSAGKQRSHRRHDVAVESGAALASSPEPLPIPGPLGSEPSTNGSCIGAGSVHGSVDGVVAAEGTGPSFEGLGRSAPSVPAGEGD